MDGQQPQRIIVEVAAWRDTQLLVLLVQETGFDRLGESEIYIRVSVCPFEEMNFSQADVLFCRNNRSDTQIWVFDFPVTFRFELIQFIHQDYFACDFMRRLLHLSFDL